MSSSLTSKPCQQLSRLLLISPNMCSSWSTTGNRTRSSSAPPDRVLRHCALTGCVSIDSSAIQTEKLPLSIGFCDSSSNKFFTHPTPLPLADVNSGEQRFVLPFQKVIWRGFVDVVATVCINIYDTQLLLFKNSLLYS